MRFLLALAAAAALATGALAQPQAAPDCSAPEHRAFDFWLGEWDVYRTGADEIAGRSTIAAADNGCVVTEHFRSVGAAYSGRSLNLYDRETGRWRQIWMDSTGDITDFQGGPTETGMMLTAENDVSPQERTPHQTRMIFVREANGDVRQIGQASADGVTWAGRYDFTYRRRAP